MYKVSAVSLFLLGVFIFNLPAQTSQTDQKPDGIAAQKQSLVQGGESSSFQNKGLNFFNIYFEWGSGDFLKPVAQRIIREEFDIKATYLYTFAAVPWLAVGLTSQFKTSPKWAQNNTSLGKTSSPDIFVMSANMMFGRMLDIAFGSDGTLTASLLYSKNLPEVAGLKSHSFNAIAKTVFFLRGNVYDATPDAKQPQGWWDSSELRLQYAMKFNDYVGLRPEMVFAVIGTGILAGRSFLDNFIMRLNPRLYMYAPGGWSFFVEPRLFLYGWGSPSALSSDPAVELKFGIDYSALWQ